MKNNAHTFYSHLTHSKTQNCKLRSKESESPKAQSKYITWHAYFPAHDNYCGLARFMPQMQITVMQSDRIPSFCSRGV